MSIEIHSQAEYDQHKDSEYALVIRCPTERIIVRGRSRVEVWDNSYVEARDDSHVEARDNSHVEARDNSSVVALGNSSVEARSNIPVVAYCNSSVVAYGNSPVVARNNSHVVALGSSHIMALDDSSVEAYSNSYIEAWDNSSVDAFDNSHVLTHNNNRVRTFGNATSKKWIQPKYDRTILDAIPEKDGEDIVLYKCVNPETNCDFHSGKIRYEIGAEVVAPDFDPYPDRQCGGGLHLCFSALDTQVYNKGKILKCLVRPEDIVIYPHDISKVRCRAVRPVAVVDVYGNVITEVRG